MNCIAQNAALLREKISAACQSAGRPADSVQIIAVSKHFSVLQIRAAAAAGLLELGENYLQESITKIEQLSELALIWHFIGRLQSNKSKIAARHFDWVHTIDSASLGRRLSAARAGLPPLNVCLQINIDREASKSGVLSQHAAELAQTIAALPNLRLRGLMTIPSRQHVDKGAPYRALAALRDEIAARCKIPLDVLSMGMSGDFAAAIAEGATHIRIGTAIFGRRERNHS